MLKEQALSAGGDAQSIRHKWDKRYTALDPDVRRKPTPFVQQCLPQLPARGRALDIAAGAGRHSLVLAEHGLQVDAVDISCKGMQLARQRALDIQCGSENIQFIVADVERAWLPHCQYAVILVAFFLYRPLFPLIKNRLLPGGWLVYETFTNKKVDSTQGWAPSKREFLLNPGELKEAFFDFEMLFYAENNYRGRPAAQLLARKPEIYDKPY
jgi:SAM-dependent methyltransferase